MNDPLHAARTKEPSDRSWIMLLGIPILAIAATLVAWLLWSDYRSFPESPATIPIEEAHQHLYKWVRLKGPRFHCDQVYEYTSYNPVSRQEYTESFVVVTGTDDAVFVLARYNGTIRCGEVSKAPVEGELRTVRPTPLLGKLREQGLALPRSELPALELCTSCNPEETWVGLAIAVGFAVILWLWFLKALWKFRRSGR